LIPEFLSRLDLQHGFIDTLNLWDKEGAGIGQLEPDSSRVAETPSIEFSARALLPVKLVDILVTCNIGTKHNIDDVCEWKLDFRKAVKKIGDPLPLDDDDFALDFEGTEAPAGSDLHSSADNGELVPTLTQHLIFNESIEDLRLLYELDPCVQNPTRLVGKKFQLNNLQLLAVTALLTRICQVDKRRGYGYENRLSSQFLTYIGGEGGTGKTLLVLAFLRGVDIFGRLPEVLLMVSTGSAAAHIGGVTIHSALEVSSYENSK
jgi:hypothetical protein